jgi:hypothetical protein
MSKIQAYKAVNLMLVTHCGGIAAGTPMALPTSVRGNACSIIVDTASARATWYLKNGDGVAFKDHSRMGMTVLDDLLSCVYK